MTHQEAPLAKPGATVEDLYEGSVVGTRSGLMLLAAELSVTAALETQRLLQMTVCGHR